MSKYVYQKFLLNCDYENVKITDCSYYKGDIGNLLDYRCDYCLFDIGKNMIRKLSITDIDEQVDTEDDWNRLLDALKGLDVLVLYDYDIDSSNPIIKNYREATLKAYLCRLEEDNIKICLA